MSNRFLSPGRSRRGAPWTTRLRLEAVESRLAPAVIVGSVFVDANADGIRQASEVGQPGVRVYVDANANGKFDAPTATAPGESFAFTDPMGKYAIQTPATGSVVVAQIVPPGFVQTTPTPGPVTTAPPGTITPGPLFGNAPLLPPPPPPAPTGGVIRGGVFVDLNGDGVRQNTEPGQGGVLVFIDLNNDGQFNPPTATAKGEPSVVSAPDGKYQIGVPQDGSYTVLQRVPPGFTQTAPTGAPGAVTVAGGSVSDGPLFGNKPVGFILPGRVQGRVFADKNGNAQQDVGEPGVWGVRVYADLNNNSKLDPGEPATVTAFDGRYSLILAPGSYALRQIVPPGFVETVAPGTVTITSGQTVANALFGIKKLTTAGKPAVSDGFGALAAIGQDDGEDLSFLGGITV